MRLTPEDAIAWYNLACSYTVMGMIDPGFFALERALELGYDYARRLHRDPDLKAAPARSAVRSAAAAVRAPGLTGAEGRQRMSDHGPIASDLDRFGRRRKDTASRGAVIIKKNSEAKGAGIDSRSGPIPSESKAAPITAKPETKSLTSFDIFELCVQRARNLVKLHETAHGKAGKPERFTSDAHRAAIVLAISALDAFVRDFVISRTRALLAAKTSTLPPALSEQIKRFLKDDDLLQAARKDDLIERVEKAFRSDFEKRSFQGTKNIEEQLRVVGYQDIFHEVAIRAGLNEDTLRADLDRFTQRRDAIAHRGITTFRSTHRKRRR